MAVVSPRHTWRSMPVTDGESKETDTVVAGGRSVALRSCPSRQRFHLSVTLPSTRTNRSLPLETRPFFINQHSILIFISILSWFSICTWFRITCGPNRHLYCTETLISVKKTSFIDHLSAASKMNQFLHLQHLHILASQVHFTYFIWLSSTFIYSFIIVLVFGI